MTTYKYSAVDKNGKSINGSIEAESEQKAAEQLKKRGKDTYRDQGADTS